MKIDTRVINRIHIEFLHAGNTFIYNDSYYIVTNKRSYYDDTYVVSCVNLDNGQITCFRNNETVVPIKLKVVEDKDGD